ncbi:MAG TPA: adenosine deaminase [Candidatus Limnocylindria bacterium]
MRPDGGINLHSHLEGSVRPGTAAELAAELGLPAPDGGWAAALEMRTAGTLTTFLWHVAHAYPLFANPDAVRRTVREAIEDACGDGQRYLELRFGPATHVRSSMDLDEIVAAACAGVEDATRGEGIDAGLVVCALRHHDPATNAAVARAAARFAGRGVVGFDVAGDELVHPDLDAMREPFSIAAAAGLGLTAHAAEAGPASAVREAVARLGATRIGHGSRAAEDPELLAWAVQEGVCFEVCPTSNVLTGAARSYAEHPARAFVAAGCEVVVGDDDPVTTGSRLTNETRLLAAEVGLTADAVDRMRTVAAERAFCEPSVRAALRAGR